MIYRHQERSFSTEAYREAQKSLDISANINIASEASKIFNMADGKVSFQVATAYKEANTLITNSKYSGKWVVTEKEEFQDGYHLFRFARTTILIGRLHALQEKKDYVNSFDKPVTNKELRQMEYDYLVQKFYDPYRIYGSTYSVEFCGRSIGGICLLGRYLSDK